MMPTNRFDPLQQASLYDDAPAVARRPTKPPAQTGEQADGAEEPLPRQGERIAKRLARAGVSSRRDAERMIAEGRVTVNGKVLPSAAFLVTDADKIVVDGQPLASVMPTRLWRYHKPAGLVTTARDELGRPTVFDALPQEMPRVISVGRLDLPSEGLLLLTNDGALARHLELPATGWLRRYRVRVHGAPTEEGLAVLAEGLVIDGIVYEPIEATLDRRTGSNAWLTVGLREGKNREVRRVMEYLGFPVSRLIRIGYGPFELGNLPPGQVEEAPLRILRDHLPDFFADSARETQGARHRPLRINRALRGDAHSGADGKPAGEATAAPPARRPSAKRAREAVERIAYAGHRPPASGRGRSADSPSGEGGGQAAAAKGRGRGAHHRR
jgi:23S rRNA pseudouridine2605 synthase